MSLEGSVSLYNSLTWLSQLGAYSITPSLLACKAVTLRPAKETYDIVSDYTVVQWNTLAITQN